MSDDQKEPGAADPAVDASLDPKGLMSQYIGQGLLESMPPTDPAVLKAFADDRARNLHYSAIGQVAACWSYFEAVIDTWLMAFADVAPRIGVCFTSQMLGSRPRIDAFIALVRCLGAHEKWPKVLEAFAKDVQGLSEQRNRAVHDVWDLSESSMPHRFEASAKRRLRIAKIHVPTESLLRLARHIEALRERLDDLGSEIFTELRASRDTTPPRTAPYGHKSHLRGSTLRAPHRQLPPLHP
jgi:hypothetical protein